MEMVGAVVFIIALVVAVGWGGFQLYAYYAPKYEEVRHQTNVNSRAYVEATVRELYDLNMQFEQAETDSARKIIRLRVLHLQGTIDEKKLPSELAAWIEQLRGTEIDPSF